MIIRKLVLYKFKRFFLTNITKLTYAPSNNTQLILGKNGSGKSQLFNQLTPLPPVLKKEFYPDGYKIIEISHKGKEYIISSGYHAPNKHSFIVNGTELNTGGTITVQNDLVKEHFRIDNKINEILLGINNFTIMTPNERKKWISHISRTDYSYAIGVYNDLRSRYSVLSGGVKLLESNLEEYNNILSTNGDRDTLVRDIKELNSVIEELLTNIDHSVENDTISVRDSVLKDTELLRRLSNTNITSRGVLVNSITKAGVTIENTKKIITDIMSDIGKIESMRGDKSKSEYIAMREDLIKRMRSIEDGLTSIGITDIDFKDMKNINDNWGEIRPVLIERLNELERYRDTNSRKEDIDALQSTLDSLNSVYDSLEAKRLKLDTELEHLKEHKSKDAVTCPKCNNIFNPGYSADLEKSLTIEKSKLTELLQTKKEEIARITKLLNTTHTRYEHVKGIRELVYRYNNLKPIWVWLLANTKLTEAGFNIDNKLNQIVVLSNDWKDYISYTDKLKQIDTYIEKLTIQEDTYKQLTSTNLEELRKRLYQHKELLSSTTTLLEDNHKLLTTLDHIDTIKDRLKRNIAKHYAIRNNKLKILKNNYLTDVITKLKETHHDLTVKLNRLDNVNSRLVTDKKKLTEYEHRIKVLKIMLAELSPKEGIIAKSINSFLQVFITDINSIINRVWSYKIELQIPDIEDKDLDYKFKVKVDDNEVIEDINRLSSSMKEIVDLAFRIVFMMHFRINDFPLMLDEFGRTFDKEHQYSAYNAIDKILSSSFTQVFIISHYSENYGMLSDADINILSTDGIDAVSKKYNENLILE